MREKPDGPVYERCRYRGRENEKGSSDRQHIFQAKRDTFFADSFKHPTFDFAYRIGFHVHFLGDLSGRTAGVVEVVDDPGNHPPDIIVFMRSNASNPFHRMEHGRICCSGKRERDGRITFRNSVEVFPPPFVADGRLAANNALQPEQTLDEHSTIDQSLLLTGVTGNDELMVEYLIEARTGSVESTMARAGFDLTYLEIGGRFDANVNIPRQISAAQLSPRTFETNLLTFIPHVPTEKITAVNGASAPDELKKTLDSLRFGDKVVLTVEDTKKGKRREVAVYAQ